MCCRSRLLEAREQPAEADASDSFGHPAGAQPGNRVSPAQASSDSSDAGASRQERVSDSPEPPQQSRARDDTDATADPPGNISSTPSSAAVQEIRTAAASVQLPALQVPDSNAAAAQPQPPASQRNGNGRSSTGRPQNLTAPQQALAERREAHRSQAHIKENLLDAFNLKPS